MNKTVWIIKTENFIPRNWTDNPEHGIAHSKVDSTTDCLEIAKGFNESEIANPKGYWAIVTDEQPIVGQSVRIERSTTSN